MLVLSRKRHESIRINDDIRIVVVDIQGDKVRLGVEAPLEVIVHRNEVYESIKLTAERNEQCQFPDQSRTHPNGGDLGSTTQTGSIDQ